MIAPLAGWLLTAVLAVQTEAPVSPATAKPDIIVEGRTLQSARRMARDVTRVTPRGQIPRWNNPLCLRIIGLHSADADLVRNGINATAKTIGVPIGKPDCTANAVIVMTNDADRVAERFEQRNASVFQRMSRNASNRAESRRLWREAKPVRWLYVSQPETVDGIPLLFDDQIVKTPFASRLITGLQESLAYTIALVDADKIKGLTKRQIIDFLTMTIFTTPNPDAQFDPSTILSLFQQRDAGNRPPEKFTGIDRSTLRMLYKAMPNQTADMLRRRLASAVLHPSPIIDVTDLESAETTN